MAARSAALGRLILIGALLAGPGCALPGPSREAEGWIEFAFDDTAIPAHPLGDPARPTCRVLFSLDDVALVDEEIEPAGAAAPYRIEQSWRFSRPPGRYLARIRYIGCRFKGEQADAIAAEIEVPVVARHTTRLYFDGPTLSWEGFFPDSGQAF